MIHLPRPGSARPGAHARAIPAPTAGRAWPLGATPDGEGINFALFSAEATRVELCLFNPSGRKEIARLALPERDGDIWHGHVAGIGPGTVYGYRVHGPYQPEQGLRFNPGKLLLDPYAREIHGRLRWSDALMGYRVGSPRIDLSFDGRDSAFAMPKARVPAPAGDWGDDRPPLRPLRDTVIYEAHVKGLTAAHPGLDQAIRGTYAGLGSEPVIEHLLALGITAVELLPVHAFIDDRFLVMRGLRNYWGYQTVGFFAPEPRYMSRDALAEFRAMVRRLHDAGIEVILDVVYNHSGEGDELGPTLSFRGIDNRSYYRLTDGGRYYINATGTGNTLNLAHPMVLRMATDSLRYWAAEMGVDGFRFDLATTLARGAGGFDASGAFLTVLRQDPVLSRVKLIAEPWDLGPNGYQLGNFPHPLLEWNDRFRDGVRRFWRGDPGLTAELAKRILGSAEAFDRAGRAATASVNYLASHDGFTLQDLVSYREKHNEANGEDNRDGHADNHSDNFGTEGPSLDPAVIAARARRVRNLLATLFLSQGTPMLLAGDEQGNGQGGNNNAYAQDNPVGWVDWRGDPGLTAFVRRLAALRRAHPVLRQRRFLHAVRRAWDGLPDLEWRMADGRAPCPDDWNNPDWRTLCVILRGAAEGAAEDLRGEIFLVFNAGPAQPLVLPGGPWLLALDTGRPELDQPLPAAPNLDIAAQTVLAFIRPPAAGATGGP